MTKVREPVPGEVLGQNYILESELGRGGFGIVFKARHIDIDRVVAIKVLLATYAAKDDKAKERFKREATIAASLDYPNSLRIFDYGQTDEGVFYIVMEFIQGKDLGKILEKEGRLAVPRAIHIIRQVLYALMEAHARGIVHRDIKPDNVMLVPLAYDPEYVKVMDFGIAKMVSAGEEITKAGITLGTPRYMPIEQLKGERLGPSTDLYAVGLVLYEMLVGRPAFTGETAVDTALAVMQSPSVTVPEDADVPEPLRKIIAKASSRHAEDRYQSARAFLEALNSLDPVYLDVDAADRERFAAEGSAAAPRPKGATAEVKVDRTRPTKPSLDLEDGIKTQAISTADVLAAKPPRAAAQLAETLPIGRDAPTRAMESVAPTFDQRDSGTVMVGVAGSPAQHPPASETSLVDVIGRPAPAGKTASGAVTTALLAINSAILVIVIVMLLRSL